MQKAYNRIKWANHPSEETPLNESNLNKMDAAIDELDNRIIEMNMTMQGPVTQSAANAAAAQGSAEVAAECESAAKASANNAKASEEVCADALEEIRQTTYAATFTMNFATGNLEYNSMKYLFAINNESGNLEWGVR
jgi:hypothetical protein